MKLRVHYLHLNITDNKNSTNKTDRHYTTEILLKVALNTITLTLTPGNKKKRFFGEIVQKPGDIHHVLDQQA